MNKCSLKIVCFFLTLACNPLHINAADLIIFSYNRPLQLEALLRSITAYVTNYTSISILMRAKGDDFQAAYQELQDLYPKVKFYEQNNPPADFKPLLLDLIQKSTSKYVCFAVDDIIVTDTIDLLECTQALEQTDAYGFYLRLGSNITYSYNFNISLKVPIFTPIKDDILGFNFTGKSYWAYPNTVDMTVYKKADILPYFIKMNYNSPNRLEGTWHQRADLTSKGLCFSHSKMINTPLNVVQENWISKHENFYSTEELLSLWQQGLRLDIEKLYQIDNESSHISHLPLFIPRNS